MVLTAGCHRADDVDFGLFADIFRKSGEVRPHLTVNVAFLASMLSGCCSLLHPPFVHVNGLSALWRPLFCI
jgi:hypothetical protein